VEKVMNIIDGKEVPAESGEVFQNIDPSSEEVIAEVAKGSEADVNKAVEAAERAFYSGPWGKMAPAGRAAALAQFSALIMKHVEKLAAIETRDVGKPIKFTQNMDAPLAGMIFSYYASVADKLQGAYHLGDPNYVIVSYHEPIGVVGCIIPWNYPLLIAGLKLAPALAAGNTCVVKVSVDTPMSVTEVAKIALEAGIPPGVVNVVHGPGREVGEAIASHPCVRKVSFTGSTEVGKRVGMLAAEQVKPVTLELGGKNPNIVFDDADMDAAVSASLFTAFINTGQICTSGSRIIVHKSIADEFISRLVEKAKELKQGPPSDPSTDQGPMISKGQYEKVLKCIETGRKEAETIWEGTLPANLKKGFWIPIHIFRPKDQSSLLAKEEIFGPVLSILTFDSEEEAIAIANDVAYGLSASFWTNDFRRVVRLSHAIDAGIIWGNTVHYLNMDVPYGGHKMSGIGVELGTEGAKAFMKPKCVYLNAGPDKVALK